MTFQAFHDPYKPYSENRVSVDTAHTMEKTECNCKHTSNSYLISSVADDTMRIKANVMNTPVTPATVNTKYH